MRMFLSLAALAVAFVGAPFDVTAAQSSAPVRVAFVISEGFDVIDVAGSWEVFQDTTLPASASHSADTPLFELYTVSAGRAPVTSSGGGRVIPKYTFETAPTPDIVIIGAQSDRSQTLMTWLRKQYEAKATLAAVCVGADQLARTGLLDGKKATTHHEWVEKLRKLHPQTEWLQGRRFVRNGERLYTAGGLTSGIDLALHLVAERFGTAVAQATADEMEYRGDGWK